jgi:hypothetical protein
MPLTLLSPTSSLHQPTALADSSWRPAAQPRLPWPQWRPPGWRGCSPPAFSTRPQYRMNRFRSPHLIGLENPPRIDDLHLIEAMFESQAPRAWPSPDRP